MAPTARKEAPDMGALTPTQQEAAAILAHAIEDRITAALTPRVRTRLALKGITEAQAREHLTECAMRALLVEYAA